MRTIMSLPPQQFIIMQRRAYLASFGLVTGTALAGCSSSTGGNNSSNGSGGNSGSGGSDSTEASGDSDSTEASGDSESTEASGDSDSTEASGDSEGTEMDEGEATETESSADSDGESGQVSLDEKDVVDGVTLDSSEWYNEDFSTGIRGELTTEQDFDFLFINAKIYDSDDTRIGEGSDSSSDVPSGETVKFDCILAPDDPDAVASYDLEITPDA